MLRGSYTVWSWFEGADPNPVYIGWGKTAHNSHPADRAWISAQDGKAASPLTRWLGNLPRPPRKVDHGLWGKDDARMLATAKRSAAKRNGARLLSSKPFESCIGGGSSRAVRSPGGTVYGSVRLAADILKVNPSTILRWCVANRNGWSYLE